MKTSINKKASRFIATTFGIMAICLLMVGFISIWKMRFDTIGSRQKQDSEIFSKFISQQIEGQVDDVKAYLSSPWWQDAVKKANLGYENWGPEAIKDYMAGMDEKWVAEPDSQLQEWLGSRMSQRLKNLAEQHPIIAEIFLTDQYGGLVAASDKTSDFYQADENWWQRAYNNGTGDDFFGEVELDESSGKISSAIAIPIKDETGRIIGISKTALDIDLFCRPMIGYKFGKTGHVELIDGYGNVIYHPRLKTMDKSFFPGVYLDRLLAKKNGFDIIREGSLKTNSLIAAARVKSPILDANRVRWIVIVAQSENEIFFPLYKIFCIGLIFMLAVFFLLMKIVSGNISDIFVSPLQKIRDGALRLSGGDLDCKIDLNTGDEIEDLADVFNKMTESLKSSTTSIENLNEEVAARKKSEDEREIALRWQKEINALQQSLLAPSKLDDRLKSITEGIVRIFGADFCRIWLIRRGDLCKLGCVHSEIKEGPHICRYRDKCLHLMASSGRYTHTNGKDHARVPFGCYKIGLVASGEEHKFLTNDVVNDPHVHNHEWAREFGLASFAGYQLRIPSGETIGVLALFSKHPILQTEDAMLDTISGAAAFVVQESIDKENIERQAREMEALLKESIKSHEILSSMLADNNKIRERLENNMERLKEAQGQLIHAEKMESIGRMASGIAHEVKNPLGIIIQGLNYLEEALPHEDKDKHEMLQMMKDSVKKADSIVHSLLDFSRSQEFKRTPMDINYLIESSVNLMQYAFKSKGIELVRELGNNLPKISVDAEKIEQVFVNLFNNAIDAMPNGGKLYVRSRLSIKRAMIVEVEDTGVGIKEDIIDKIFEPFFTTKNRTEGTGLGLSLSKGIIEMHEGFISVESKIGKGAKFTIVFQIT